MVSKSEHRELTHLCGSQPRTSSIRSGEEKDVSDAVWDCNGNSPGLDESYISDSDSDVTYYSDDEHVYERLPAKEAFARAKERCLRMEKWLAEEKRRDELGEDSPDEDGMSDSAESEIQGGAERESEDEA
ncbi:hypothetical protein OH76DRAFT_1007269 [Lentinus brumalis]|uniref:Uncharacterized protein n=1 Tax=Lentinus brumalis TaxID=2498619 RepID=A0A371CY82_9APHY|nr:hypothetical protein OH76DRAFT_1007269 [Polyporus brumalis]